MVVNAENPLPWAKSTVFERSVVESSAARALEKVREISLNVSSAAAIVVEAAPSAGGGSDSPGGTDQTCTISSSPSG